MATDGDHELGGANWDAELASFLAERFVEQHPDALDPFDDVYAEADLLTQAEEVKQSLSQRERADVLVTSGADRASVPVTRDGVRGGHGDAARAHDRAHPPGADGRRLQGRRRASTAVLLVGGSSKMPAVARRLEAVFGFEPQLADPDLAVAKGAALYGHKKQLERTVQEATDRGVDLTKAVADVAAEHGMTSDEVRSVVDKQVVNVVSRGFGVIALRDDIDTAIFLVRRNDAVPISVEERFYTVSDDQDTIRVRVFEQGGAEESPRPEDNTVLVEGEITGLPPGYPRGTEITMRMTMGGDGILTVTAHHVARLEPLTLVVETGEAMSAAEVAAERDAVSLLKNKL